jgi:predicted GNAT family acetyltransferase
MTSDQNQIEHTQTPAHGEFTIGRDAIMTYRKLGDGHIEVNHTRVAREAQGRGLAGQLYRAMVEYARSQGLKVTPTCSYVVKMFERFPEDRDLLKD